MKATLYRVECNFCSFQCCTDSGPEAGRVRLFHDNWNSDQRTGEGVRLHQPRVTASAYSVRPAHQVVLEVVLAVPA